MRRAMNKRHLLNATAAVAIGATLLHASPAMAAGSPVIDVLVDGAIEAMNKAVNKSINALTDLTNPSSLSTMLSNGFSQLSNYSKASVGASEQIADANNLVQATQQKRLRDVEIRDEQTASPEFCTTLDSNQSIVAASGQALGMLRSIQSVTDARGEAKPGTPSYYGIAQGVEANTNLHLLRYCSAADQQEGLCTTVSKYPDGDQEAISLFGQDSLAANGGLDTANDYVTSLIQPVAPAALRGDQLTSVSAKAAFLERRRYNARMSLARMVFSRILTSLAPTMTLTPDQQAELQAEGQPALQKASWLQTVSLEVNRRISGVRWAGMLQQMPPASVMREVATELALQNYIALQSYRIAEFNASLSATQLATMTEQGSKGVTPMTSPTIASN